MRLEVSSIAGGLGGSGVSKEKLFIRMLSLFLRRCGGLCGAVKHSKNTIIFSSLKESFQLRFFILILFKHVHKTSRYVTSISISYIIHYIMLKVLI